MEKISSQWYSVTGQEMMGTNWKSKKAQGSSFKWRGHFFTVRLVENWKRLLRNMPLCPHPWRYSKPNWRSSWARCPSWPYFQQEDIELQSLHRTYWVFTILWCCAFLLSFSIKRNYVAITEDRWRIFYWRI